MDLQIKLQNTTLKIRVAGLIKTKDGYLFEKQSKDNYFFLVGGKVMLNESSEETIKREIKEEINMEVREVNQKSVIENFYTSFGENIHEICFVYEVKEIFSGEIPFGFVEIAFDDLDKNDIRPIVIKDILKSEKSIFKNYIIK